MRNRTSVIGLMLFGLSMLLFLQNQKILAASPDAITRAEATKLLLQARSKKLPYVQNTGSFPDVTSGRPYEQYLLLAEKFGIISEDAAGNLHPDASVSRADFLKMVTFTFGLTSRTSYKYKDVSPFSWYAPYAGIAFNFGIFRSTGSFLDPSTFVSKAEVAEALEILLDAQLDKHRPSVALMSAEAEQYNLNLYATISTLTEEHAKVSASLLTVKTADPTPATRTSAAAARERVMILVNAERIKRGIPPLHPDALLSVSAQEYSEEMLSRHFFSHESPGGGTLSDRMLASGYYNPALQPTCMCVKQFVVGENLASGQKTAEEVVSDWMDSPSHRDTLLNPAFTDTGVGVAAGIWVEHFGGVERSDEE